MDTFHVAGCMGFEWERLVLRFIGESAVKKIASPWYQFQLISISLLLYFTLPSPLTSTTDIAYLTLQNEQHGHLVRFFNTNSFFFCFLDLITIVQLDPPRRLRPPSVAQMASKDFTDEVHVHVSYLHYR